MGHKDTEIDALAKENNEQAKVIEDVTTDNMLLQDQLNAAMQALKDGRKFSKLELKSDICKRIKTWIRTVGFRTTIFAKDDELVDFCHKVYDNIKGKLNLETAGTDHHTPKDQFVRIYKSFIQEELGKRRQYVQTGSKEGFKSKSCFGWSAQ